MQKKFDPTKFEPLLTSAEPVGNNNLTSRATFLQRKLYETLSFDNEFTENAKSIDLWYDKVLYGRIDTNARPIHLSEKYLKQVSGTSDVFALNFVVDAFQDLISFHSYALSRNMIERDSVYSSMKPISGWSSANSFYHNLMTSIYNKFKNFVSDTGKEKQITNFNTFMNVFVQFIDSITPLIPVTRSKLMTSRIMDPASTGLIIELAVEDHGDDVTKIENYITDPNYAYFKETAMRFGFAVDKHAPWRLVADLGSPMMKSYLANYGLDVDTLFQTYYYRSYELDLEALKVYTVQFYNSYIGAKPLVKVPDLKNCNGSTKVSQKNIFRSPISTEQVDAETTEEFWLRLYTYIRAREENKSWNQFEFEKIVRNSIYFNKGLDKESSIEYIYRKTHSPQESSKKERNFYFANSQRLV